MHDLQHKASLNPTLITKTIISDFLHTSHEILVTQTFTSNVYRTLAQALLCLIQTLIVTNPVLIDDDILELSNKIFKIEKLMPFINEVSSETDENLSKKRSKSIFSHLICPRLILQLNESRDIDVSLKCLLKWLKSLVECLLVSVDRLSDMFVSLFQHEWNKENLDKIRYLSENVSNFTHTRNCDEKSNLFLDLVADLAGDLDI